MRLQKFVAMWRDENRTCRQEENVQANVLGRWMDTPVVITPLNKWWYELVIIRLNGNFRIID